MQKGTKSIVLSPGGDAHNTKTNNVATEVARIVVAERREGAN